MSTQIDDNSNLININRLTTYDGLIKAYINEAAAVGDGVVNEVSTLIADSNASGKAIIADAIEGKGVDTSNAKSFTELAAAIDSIKTGSGNATADKVLQGATFTNSTGEELTGTIPIVNITSPITPGSSNKSIVSKGSYVNNDVVVSGDSDLAAGNIRSGVNIFGVSGTFTGNATAAAANILSGKTAGINGSMVTGTMTNNGKVTPAGLNAGGSYTIPAGYHDGTGVVTANALSGQTSGTAGAGDILATKTAWVGGTQLTGTMTNNGAVAPSALAAGGSYTIPAGYHNGSGKVTAKSLADQTAATAAAANILTGKTAWVGGSQITGTMTDNGAKTSSLNCGGSYTIPAGYHNGSGVITANSLASQTSADATAAQILSGKTAWVNGSKITGTISSKAAATYTPGTSNQTIAAGQYLSGAQTISGSSNLVAGNIKSGVKIFNVTGTLEEGIKLKTKTVTIPANSGSYSLGLTEVERAGARFVSITAANIKTTAWTDIGYLGNYTSTGTLPFQSFYTENIGNGTSSSSVNLSGYLSGIKATTNINILSNSYSITYTNQSPSSITVDARTMILYYLE